MNAPLSTLNEFMQKHFYEASGNRWEGSVHVICDVEKFNDTSLKILEHPKLVGAFGSLASVSVFHPAYATVSQASILTKQRIGMTK